MKLIRCNNGHFYDQDKFGSCPNCNGGDSAANQLTDAFQAQPPVQERVIPQPDILTEEDATMPLDRKKAMDEISNMSNVNSVFSEEREDDHYTVSITPGGREIGTAGMKPVVGWLICLSGEHTGKDFRLVQGKNFIGRDPAMDVCLAHEKTVSRDKHALIVYEPRHHLYLIQSGESRELTYVNDQVILESRELEAMDKILIGDVNLLFVPLCSPEFNWTDILEEKDESDEE